MAETVTGQCTFHKPGTPFQIRCRKPAQVAILWDGFKRVYCVTHAVETVKNDLRWQVLYREAETEAEVGA